MRDLILLAFIGSALAVPQTMNRIIGGEDTTIDRYPFMVNMHYEMFPMVWIQNCGGSLLTTRAVLSAAHCYEGDKPAYWRAILGSSWATSGFGGSFHPVSQIIMHHQYNTPMLDNNVAIVRLSIPAIYSETVQPARIAGRNLNLPDGTQVTSIGWGAFIIFNATTDSFLYAEKLQRVDINLINQVTCSFRYRYLQYEPGFENWSGIRPGMLCAGILDEDGKGACHMDCGGPLVYHGDVVVGITSGYYRCADKRYPGLYTRVSHYADWIVANA